MTGVDLTDAVIHFASFTMATSYGFTSAQLYSTASYKNHDLIRMEFSGCNLSGWDLSNQDLTTSSFVGSNLTNTNLSNSNLVNGNFKNATLDHINFTNAFLKGCCFDGVNLAQINFTDTVVADASFWQGTSHGLTREQIYSTKSYKTKSLGAIGLGDNNLSDWDFSGQSLWLSHFSQSVLTKADFNHADIFMANFSEAILTDANFTDATIRYADFSDTTSRGFTREKLYSTASYKNKSLDGIKLHNADLSGWDFSSQQMGWAEFNYSDLTNTKLNQARLDHANFSGANLKNALLTQANLNLVIFDFADLRGAVGADLSLAKSLHDTIRPDGSIQGLSLLSGEALVVRDGDLRITVKDKMTLAEGSSLKLLFSDGTWGSAIGLAAGAVPDLGGTLSLEFAEGIDPNTMIGRTFHLFDWNNQLMTGEEFSQILTQSGLVWNTDQLYTTGNVTLVPEPGMMAMVLFGGMGLSIRRRK